LAHTSASATGACSDHLAEQALADTLYLTSAATVGAGGRLGAFSSAGGIAVAARHWQLQLNIDLITKHCLFERKVCNDFEVLSARRTTWTSAPATTTEWASAACAAEEGIKNVTKSTAKHVFVRLAAAAAATAHTGFAELIVALALLVIGKHLVSPGDLLELALGLGVIRVGIGVQLASTPAICLFDFVS
jgi:hypothetical protein